MRLDRLQIAAYRNLQAFDINFDESQPTTVLLGRNGSGKSNLIEALVQIFRDLEAAAVPPFAYTLDYVCRDRRIRIDADPERSTKRLDISVDGEPVSSAVFLRDAADYLPSYVFAYYSGWSSRLERHFDRPTRKHYTQVLRSTGQVMPMRRLFLCRREYSQLVLLAFFLIRENRARRLLKDYLRIERFKSALFVLKTPWWRGTGAPNKAQVADGDPRLWHARGAFRPFLDRLWQHSLAPIRNTETIERDVRRQGETTQRLYLFIKNEEELGALMERGEDAKTLFAYLEALFLCDLIDEVRITVERTDGTCLKFTQLSEGEQQLLTVIGLLLFTQNDESLYLLDEPDTHLNPVWTHGLLDLVQQNIRTEKGHLVIATHNPLMIGSLHKNQVRLLAQGEGGTTAAEPDYDPIGIGVEGLLKSELYGLRSTLAPEVLKKMDRHYVLLGKKHRSRAERVEFSELAVELNELGISRSHPNPYFDQFANAMARRTPHPDEEALSKNQLDEQALAADDVLKEVIEEERAKARSRK